MLVTINVASGFKPVIVVLRDWYEPPTGQNKSTGELILRVEVFRAME
jgi:hypothetical protein